jgi:hypothetical protein
MLFDFFFIFKRMVVEKYSIFQETFAAKGQQLFNILAPKIYRFLDRNPFPQVRYFLE